MPSRRRNSYKPTPEVLRWLHATATAQRWDRAAFDAPPRHPGPPPPGKGLLRTARQRLIDAHHVTPPFPEPFGGLAAPVPSHLRFKELNPS